MIAATLLLLLVACSTGIVQRLHEYVRRNDAPAYTFLVDPPTMLIVGLFTALIGLTTRGGRQLAAEQFRARGKLIDRLLLAFFLVFFLLIEMPAYFDLGSGHALGFLNFAHQNNNFMWNGYVELFGWKPFTFARPTYEYWWSYPMLACMALLQWIGLRIGRALGYMAAGRDPSGKTEK